MTTYGIVMGQNQLHTINSFQNYKYLTIIRPHIVLAEGGLNSSTLVYIVQWIRTKHQPYLTVIHVINC